MVCPKCGSKKALLLLTSFQCPTMSCLNYSQELACDIWTAGIRSLGGTKIGRFSSKHPNQSNKPKQKVHWDGFFKKRYKSYKGLRKKAN